MTGLPMGMATVSYGKDPRDPWDEGSDLGQGTEWPAVARPGAGADAAAGSLDGAAGKFGAIAQAAKQAASAVRSLPKGGAQALLAPVGQAGVAVVASALGLPGSPPRSGAEVPPSIPKKSVI